MSLLSNFKLEIAVTAGVAVLLTGGISFGVHQYNDAHREFTTSNSESGFQLDEAFYHALYVDNFNKADFERLTWGHQDDITNNVAYKSKAGPYTFADGSIKQVYFSNITIPQDNPDFKYGGLFFAGTTKQIPSAIAPAKQN